MLRNLLELHIQQEGTVHLQPDNFKRLYRRLRRKTLHEAVSSWRLESLKNEGNLDKLNMPNESIKLHESCKADTKTKMDSTDSEVSRLTEQEICPEKCDKPIIKVVIQDPDGVASCFKAHFSPLWGSLSTVCSAEGTPSCFGATLSVACGSSGSVCSVSSADDCKLESKGFRRCRYSLQEDLDQRYRKELLLNFSEFRRRYQSYPLERNALGTPQCGLPSPRPLLRCI